MAGKKKGADRTTERTWGLRLYQAILPDLLELQRVPASRNELTEVIRLVVAEYVMRGDVDLRGRFAATAEYVWAEMPNFRAGVGEERIAAALERVQEKPARMPSNTPRRAKTKSR